MGGFQETSMKTGVLAVSLTTPAIWRFRSLSSAFVYSRLVSDFASGMTLTMTLNQIDSAILWLQIVG